MRNRHRSARAISLGVVVLALLWASVRTAAADMVLTSDGKWFPTEAAGNLGPSDEPNDDQLRQAEDFKVEASYDVVKSTRGFNKPAGLVVKVLASDRASNQSFKRALNDASSSFFQESAEGFLAASNEAQGFGKQEALWLRVQAYAAAGAAEPAMAAINDLLTAFPKSFYFADAHVLRARILAAKGDVPGAEQALAAVRSAAGMNARDLLRAEYSRINLTLELQRKYDEAQADYRKLVADAEKGEAAQSAVTRQQALVGLGNCLLALKKEQDARGFFEKATESRDGDVLAGAYAGLGDIALTDAKGLREGGKLKEAKERLEEALLHYLRVTVHYRTQANDESPILRCLDNQAKVFVALFEMSGSKDCELASQAYAAYADLARSLPDGPQKKAVVKAALEFDQKREAAGCKQK